MPSSTTATVDPTTSLIVFNSRMSAMVHAGISVMRIFEALSDLPGPIATCVPKIAEEVGGWATLSEGLERFPDLFPRFYIALVRAGEIGGVLEVCFDRAGKMLCLQRRLAAVDSEQASTLFRYGDATLWVDLSALQRTAALLLFSETLSLLLSAGVPVLRSMDCAADMLPGEAKVAFETGAIAAIRAGAKAVDGLEPFGIFPKFWLALFDMGELTGTVDVNMHLAAEALETELYALAGI